MLVGRCAVLIRGPSGSGKSRLALNLLGAARAADAEARLDKLLAGLGITRAAIEPFRAAPELKDDLSIFPQ